MGSPKQTTQSQGTSANTVAPWSPAQPYIQDLYGKASAALSQVPATAFDGQRVAGQSAATQAGLSQAVAQAPAAATGVDQLRGLAMSSLNGDYLDPSKNTALQGAIKAAIDPVQKNLMTSVLPGISSAAQTSGAYGGARQGVQTALALSDFDKTALDTSANLTYQDYQQERQNQLNAGTLLSGANTLADHSTGALLAAGGQQDAYQQSLLDAARQQYAESQTAPFTGLSQVMQILTAGGYNQQNGNTSSTSTQTTSTPLATQVLQGLLGGAGLAASVAGIPGAGTAASSALNFFKPSSPTLDPMALVGGL